MTESASPDWQNLELDCLNSNEYRLLVAPALECITDIAARRGDPQCYNDMSAMLALFTVVTGLAHCYIEEWGQLGGASEAEAINSAPLGACLMIFQQAKLPENACQDMLRGLSGAWRHLVKEAVIGGEYGLIKEAWRKLVEDDFTSAKIKIRDAAMAVIASVDDWEAQRNYQEISLQ